MNVGFSNKASLKAVLLPEAMRARTDWDDGIAAIGLGVAAAFEQFCTRRFDWLEDAKFVTSADRSYLTLSRYPVYEVTTIKQRDDLATGFVELPITTILNLNEESGFLDFGAPLGSHNSLIEITYTGGYFWEQLEPDDGEYPTALPDGATALPADLLHAWQVQCEATAIQMDLLNGGAARRATDQSPRLADLELTPGVIEMLNPYRRFS